MNHDLFALVTEHLRPDINRWPDRHGDYHADCPYCGKPAKKAQTHFVISKDGLCYCQVCHQGTTVRALADHLNIKAPPVTTNGTSPQTTYDYYDAHGVLAYQVVRYYKGATKQFYQRRPDDKGGWVNNLKGVDRVLYRLPEVITAIQQSKPIYIVEGEKDVETLRLRGMVATTNVGGAGKWGDSYSEALRGADVYILPDCDEPGEAHAQQVRKALQGIARSARIVRLPNLPEKGDVSDWFASGHTVDELRAICKPVQTDYKVDWRAQGITLAQLQHKIFDPERWIIEGILPEGACLIAAKYKSKKSWLALALSLPVSMGGKALGRLDVHTGRVLYLDLEGRQQRIQKRARAILGVRQVAWPDNFHVFTKWPRGDEGMRELESWFASYPDTVFVVIDVLASFRRPMDKNEMMYQYDRDTVDPINELGEKYHAGIALIHHFNKGKHDDIMDSITGSTGLPSAVNTMWALRRDVNDSNITILEMRGRDLENDDPLALRWDTYLNTHVIEGPASEVAIGTERKAILQLLSDDMPRTPKEIAADLGRSVPAIQQLLRKLLNDGLIDKPGYGKYALVRKVDQADQTDQSSNNDQSSNSDRDLPTLIGAERTDQSSAGHQEDVKADSDHSDRYYKGAEKKNGHYPELDPIPRDKHRTTFMMLISPLERNRKQAQERCEEYGVNYDVARTWALEQARKEKAS